MEHLLEDLGDVLAEPRDNALAAEVIVVQSQGMERWLSMGLAQRFGVWANGAHPFPRAFIESISEPLIGALDVTERFTCDAMAFHLASLLKDLPDEPALLPIRQYLLARPGVESRLRLAEQLADAFDQVQIYRPDWCVAWEGATAASADFRPALFRLLTQRLGGRHFPAQVARLVEHLDRGDFDRKVLPERVCLFGVATLPPAFFRVFDALAHHVPVHWFLLAASREYVGAERVRSELARSKGAKDAKSAAAAQDLLEDWSLEQPLLASYGRIMRDVGLLLESDCHYVEGAGRAFVEPETTTVISTLQADLCALRRRGFSADVPKLPLAFDDRSLEVHACHGPRRELEVLRELLLEAFERDRTLQPEDVIVLLRDVDTYAPLVDAVFATEPGRAGHVPYRLSDRHLGATNPVAEAAAILLETAHQRLSAAELMRLLELRPIAARFAFDSDELATIRTWLRELGVTWGIDLADRAREGAAGQREHTIRWGLARLLLGVAMPSDENAVFHGLLPFEVEGEEAELAGRLGECAEKIFAWRERFTQERPLTEWHACLSEALQDAFAVASSEAWCMADFLQTIADLRNEAERAQFTDAVPAEVVARRVRTHYETARSTQALLAGGVTFCAMLPMRGIPARIVAMIGLDDGAFPRAPVISSFDDVARSPTRAGDRVGRDEDRHLFLETLLAARERLIITYQGRNPRDDTIRPRSVVVDELLAVVDESFEVSRPRSGKPSQRLVIEHPLHAHSPRYFDGSDGRLRVSDMGQYRAATSLEGSRYLGEQGMTEALSATALTEIDLGTFERFWAAPAEFFYEGRLGARLPPNCVEPGALDPTELDGLGRYKLTFDQWRAFRAGDHDEAALALWTAKGQRPYANLGKVVHDEQLTVTARLHALVTRLGVLGPARPRDLAFTVSGVELQAVFVDVYPIGRVDFGPSRLAAKHRLSTWLRHLVLCAGGVGIDSWLLRSAKGVATDICVEKLPAIDATLARAHLDELLRLFLVGQRAPLAFFPELSYAYAARATKGEPLAACLDRAIREYGDPLADEDDFTRPPGPRDVLRLFGADPPLTEAWPDRFGIEGFPNFAEASLAVFRPYLECVRTLSADELPSTCCQSAGAGERR